MHLEPRPGTAGPGPHLRELKDAVRALLGLDNDTAVIVRQLTCSEPGRPPLETIVAVVPMEGEAHRWTLLRPADQITENDLRATLLPTDRTDGTTGLRKLYRPTEAASASHRAHHDPAPTTARGATTPRRQGRDPQPNHRAGTPPCPSSRTTSPTRQLTIRDVSSPQPKR
ncbi:hypothetical protein ACFRFU_11190 [Streptomyces sp. NPDC056704]|uniref:hypothetical protein n=1 Tax=Streptomyces TaxID=1883 RepID=UPI0036A94676